MTNSYPSGSPGVPESSMPTGAPGLLPRRSSYASVVSGAASSLTQSYQHPSRAGAFSHLVNQSNDNSYDPGYHHIGRSTLYDPRGNDIDTHRNWGGYGVSGSWGRSGQLPSFSSAFGPLTNGYGVDGGSGGVADQFFTPSYLKGSKHVQRLEEAHRAKLIARRDAPSAHSSQPGSLSTSNSSANLNAKLVSSHRGMTFDLIEKASPLEDDGLAPLPSQWNTHDKHPSLEVLGGGQEVKFTGTRSSSERDLDASSIRADHPIPAQCGIYYYEVTILSRKRDESSIGIGFSSKDVSLNRPPGWEPESWAYHGDDGNSYCCQNSGKMYGPAFTAPDIIGCGINFRTGHAFFTRNGDFLGVAFREIRGKLFPSIGMKKTGEHIRVNFGQSPFVFDIDGMMSVSDSFLLSSSFLYHHNRRHLLRHEIDAFQIVAARSSEVDRVVIEHMIHHGADETEVSLIMVLRTRDAGTSGILGINEHRVFENTRAWRNRSVEQIGEVGLTALPTSSLVASSNPDPRMTQRSHTYDLTPTSIPGQQIAIPARSIRPSSSLSASPANPYGSFIRVERPLDAMSRHRNNRAQARLAIARREHENELLVQQALSTRLTTLLGSGRGSDSNREPHTPTARDWALAEGIAVAENIAKAVADENLLKIEKQRVNQQVEATSTAKLAVGLDETTLIQSLVLQFLSHDGYVETAKAFAEEIHEERQALDLDVTSPINSFDFVKEDEDAINRQRIRTAILDGDVDKALKHTSAYYPNVLKDNEHIYFRLRNQKFIEMVRQFSEIRSHSMNSSKKSNGHGEDWYDDVINHAMELDEPSINGYDKMDTENGHDNQADYNVLMEQTIQYGQVLAAEFANDQRGEVGKALKDSFALLAYEDPINEKTVAHLLKRDARVSVAEELNSAILVSLGKSSCAALERVIQQTTVLLDDLRESGGPGALININNDYLKPRLDR